MRLKQNDLRALLVSHHHLAHALRYVPLLLIGASVSKFFYRFAGIAVVASVRFLILTRNTGNGNGGTANGKKLTDEGNVPCTTEWYG